MTQQPAQPVPHGRPGDAAPDDVRRHPSTVGGACYLVVLATVLVGLGVVATGHWRGGVHVVATALAAAAVLRLALPSRDAGMLAVRNRFLDFSVLAVVAVVLWVLASTIPDQSI